MTRQWTHWLVYCCAAVLLAVLAIGSASESDFWFSADYKAQRLERAGKLQEAAERYKDPERQGAAYYRNGEFEEAARVFAQVPGAAGAYNQGNAFLMHGAYDAAVKAYDRALAAKPGWGEAMDNKAIAIARRDRIHNVPDDGTGGQEKSDEIVFDDKAKGERAHDVTLNTGDALSDEQLKAQWLRRVQTKPADFLKAKFASQLQEQGGTP